MASEDFNFRPPQEYFNHYDSIAEKKEVLLKSKTPDAIWQVFARIKEAVQIQTQRFASSYPFARIFYLIWKQRWSRLNWFAGFRSFHVHWFWFAKHFTLRLNGKSKAWRIKPQLLKIFHTLHWPDAHWGGEKEWATAARTAPTPRWWRCRGAPAWEWLGDPGSDRLPLHVKRVGKNILCSVPNFPEVPA